MTAPSKPRIAAASPVAVLDLSRPEERVICAIMSPTLSVLGFAVQSMTRCRFAGGDCVRVIGYRQETGGYGVIDFSFSPISVGVWDCVDYKHAFAVSRQTEGAIVGLPSGRCAA